MKAVRAACSAALPRRAFCAAALVLAVAVPARAAPDASLVPGASRIAFVTTQMGVPVEGAFSSFNARIALDPRHPQGGTITLVIDTASAALGVPQVDAELPKPAWFDSLRFPTATFQSTRIRRLGNGQFEVTGMLTIKDRTQELVVPVAVAQSAAQSIATGQFAIQRLAFRIGEGDWTDTSLLADLVQVRVRLVLTGLSPP